MQMKLVNCVDFNPFQNKRIKFKDVFFFLNTDLWNADPQNFFYFVVNSVCKCCTCI